MTIHILWAVSIPLLLFCLKVSFVMTNNLLCKYFMLVLLNNKQQVLSVHGSFEECTLAANNVGTSEHVAHGDIPQNVLKELEQEQDNDDDPNHDPDDPAEQDPDYIPITGWLLHMMNHQKAFLQ